MLEDPSFMQPDPFIGKRNLSGLLEGENERGGASLSIGNDAQESGNLMGLQHRFKRKEKNERGNYL